MDHGDVTSTWDIYYVVTIGKKKVNNGKENFKHSNIPEGKNHHVGLIESLEISIFVKFKMAAMMTS